MNGLLKLSFHHNHILKFWRHYQHSSLYKAHCLGPLFHPVTHLFKTRNKIGDPLSEERTVGPRAFPTVHSAGQSWCHLALRPLSKRICSSHSQCSNSCFMALPENKGKGNDSRTINAGSRQQPTGWLELGYTMYGLQVRDCYWALKICQTVISTITCFSSINLHSKSMKHYNYPHLADQETEARRSQVPSPRSYSWQVARLGFEFRPSNQPYRKRTDTIQERTYGPWQRNSVLRRCSGQRLNLNSSHSPPFAPGGLPLKRA